MNKINQSVQEYYNKKIKQFGPTPQGVDWNSLESQVLRFKQLTKIINTQHFSIADIGCGYGALAKYLQTNYTNFHYYGYDISDKMIKEAKKEFPDTPHIFFENINFLETTTKQDYVVASGIFNVKLHFSDDEWLAYILKTLHDMNNKAKKAFSFNLLTLYSDKELMRENLYYGDPLFLFDYCKRNFSKNVALYHDYNLYEFTLSITKEDE